MQWLCASCHSPNTSQHCTSVSMVTLVQPPLASGRAFTPQSAVKVTSKPGTLSAMSLTVETSSYSRKCTQVSTRHLVRMYIHNYVHEMWTAVHLAALHTYVCTHLVLHTVQCTHIVRSSQCSKQVLRVSSQLSHNSIVKNIVQSL